MIDVITNPIDEPKRIRQLLEYVVAKRNAKLAVSKVLDKYVLSEVNYLNYINSEAKFKEKIRELIGWID